MKNTNKFITAIVVLLVSVTSIAFSATREAEFDIRINFLSIIEIKKISDVNFGDVYIDDLTDGMKASGQFEVTGVNDMEVKFEVTEIQALTNGSHTIPMKTYVSDVENGGEKKILTLSSLGKVTGYLVAELEDVSGAESGQYNGTVKVEVDYN